MRVAVYIRWSTEDQGDGTTLAVQREATEAYVRSQGWQLDPARIFVDDGHSGGSLARPALDRLRHLVAEGEVDCVVVYKLDRLSRSVLDTVNLVLKEWEGRCHLKSAREPIDTASAMGKQFFYLLVSYAEWERNTIRERTLAGKLRRAREGRNPGFAPPYGLRKGAEAGSFAPVPEEAAVVRRIFDLYLAGLGARAIAGTLNAEGLRARGARPWGEGGVRAILANRLYAGEIAYGRGAVVASAANLAPLVPPAAFAAAQDQRRRRRAAQAPRAAASPHLLAGVLHCRCGAAMIAASKGRSGSAAYYICGAQKRQGRTACAAGFLRRDLLEDLVVQRLAARYGGTAGQARYRRETATHLKDARQRTEQAIKVATARRKSLEHQRQVVGRDYRQQAITAADFRELRAAIDADVAAVQQQLAVLAAAATAAQVAEGRAAGAAARLGDLGRWTALDPVQRKQVLQALVRRVVAFKDAGGVSVEVTWATDAAAEGAPPDGGRENGAPQDGPPSEQALT